MFPVFALIVIALVIFFFLNKKKVANEVPVAAVNYKLLLEQHIPYYQQLGNVQKTLFEQKVGGFLSDITIEGVGTAVSDADKVMKLQVR